MNMENLKNFKKLCEITKDTKRKCTSPGCIYGSKELAQYDELIRSIFVDKKITYIDIPTFLIDKEGNVITNPNFTGDSNVALVSTMHVNEKYIDKITSSSNVYILSIADKGVSNLDESDSLLIRFYGTNLNKRKVTFTISENIYNEFHDMSEKMAINKSKFVENKIIEFINKNK